MNIVFMGSKDIGAQCLEILLNFCLANPQHIISGVLTNQRGVGIREYCREKGIIEIASLDEFLNLSDVDLLISVQYHEILQQQHIGNAKLAVNLHMAPLPEYRGCNQFTYAILHERREFGTTIHVIDEGVDSGDILFEERFAIRDDLWVADLYDLTVTKSVKLFKDALPQLIAGKYERTAQSELMERRGSMMGLRRDIDDLKFIKNFSNRNELEKQIRATSMRGFSPPYMLINGIKCEFVIDEDALND